MQYLRDRQYYIDLYDLFTINECLDVIKFWQRLYKKKDTDEKLKKIPPEEIEKGFNYFYGWQLRTTKGERYRRKAETIQQWMNRDKVKQNKLDNTFPPNNIICSDCKVEMSAGDFKHLEDDENKPLRVLFFFECSKCKKRKGIFDNGKERVSKPDLCPKCGKEIKVSFKKKDEILTTTTACLLCKYKNIEVDDWGKRKLECEAEEKKDKELLKKHREEFCLSDEKGKEYIELVDKIKVANEVRKEEKQKYDNHVYQRSIQLKKLSIVELEKLLVEALEKEKYIKLSLDKPNIERHIIVPFTVQDADSSRKGYDSSKKLEKLIKPILKDTNWRLVSNSLSYRLGYVSGQLKGYEREEDMLELAGKKKELKAIPVKGEMRRRYEYDNLVQLARLIGKQEGIENMRKRRLEKEPEGFFLEATEGPYSCGICGENHPGNEIWWNLNGLRCADCWRNIKEGVIHSLKHRHDDDSNWFQDWQLRSDYGVHSSTVRKLRREGLLRGRDLKRRDGSIYCTVYLIKENKEFFKKYPKKSKMKLKFVKSNKRE